MAHVKRGTTTHARHKKVLEQSKGFRGRTSTTFRAAKRRLEKSLQYAYRDRRNKSATSAACGSSASMPRCASAASPTAASSTG